MSTECKTVINESKTDVYKILNVNKFTIYQNIVIEGPKIFEKRSVPINAGYVTHDIFQTTGPSLPSLKCVSTSVPILVTQLYQGFGTRLGSRGEPNGVCDVRNVQVLTGPETHS